MLKFQRCKNRYHYHHFYAQLGKIHRHLLGCPPGITCHFHSLLAGEKQSEHKPPRQGYIQSQPIWSKGSRREALCWQSDCWLGKEAASLCAGLATNSLEGLAQSHSPSLRLKRCPLESSRMVLVNEFWFAQD